MAPIESKTYLTRGRIEQSEFIDFPMGRDGEKAHDSGDLTRVHETDR